MAVITSTKVKGRRERIRPLDPKLIQHASDHIPARRLGAVSGGLICNFGGNDTALSGLKSDLPCGKNIPTISTGHMLGTTV